MVWEVVTDLSAYPAWNPFVVACRSTLAVGEPIWMRVRVLPFWAQPEREQVLAHEGRMLCYGLPATRLGALESRRFHGLRPLAPGGRTLYESRFALGGWLAPVVRGLLGRQLERGFRTMTEAFRARAESLHSGRASP